MPVPRAVFAAARGMPDPFLFTMPVIIAYSIAKVYMLHLFFTQAAFQVKNPAPPLTSRSKHATIEPSDQATGSMSQGDARQENARHRLEARNAAAPGYRPLMNGVSRALQRG